MSSGHVLDRFCEIKNIPCKALSVCVFVDSRCSIVDGLLWRLLSVCVCVVNGLVDAHVLEKRIIGAEETHVQT